MRASFGGRATGEAYARHALAWIGLTVVGHIVPVSIAAAEASESSEPDSDSNRCDGLWGLEDFTIEARRALFGACEHGETIDSDTAVAQAFEQIVEGPAASFGLFARAFPPSGRIKLHALVIAEQSHDCRQMREILEEALSKEPGSSTVREVFDTEHVKRCLVDPKPPPAADRALLAVTAAPSDRVFIGYSGVAPAFAELLPSDGILLRKPVSRRLYVVSLPAGLRFRVRVEGPERPEPDLHFGTLDHDEWVEAASTWSARHACLHLQISHPIGSLVILDGEVQAPTEEPSGNSGYTNHDRLVYRLSRKHRLLVLGPRDRHTRERAVLSDRSIALQPDSEDCVNQRLDLSPVANEIGILDEEVESECLSAGLDQIRLHQRLREFLTERRLSFSDLHGAIEALQVFQREVGTVNATGSEPIGAGRGRLDLGESLGAAASEPLRHGVKKLLRLRVNCSQNRHGWTYAVSAIMVDLNKISQQPRDPLKGLTTEAQVQSEVEELTDASEFRDGIVAPVARLMHLSYARFLPHRSLGTARPGALPIGTSPYHQPVDLLVSGFVPASGDSGLEQDATVELNSLSDDDAGTVCDSVQLANALQAPAGGRSRQGRTASAATAIEVGRPARARVRIDPPGDGTYLARVSIGEADDTHEHEFCVQVAPTSLEVSVLGGASFGSVFQPLKPLRAEQAYSLNYLIVSLGGRNGPALLAGVNASSLRGAAPPDLDDIRPGVPYDQRGSTRYVFRETSLLFGVGWTYSEAVLCEWFGVCSAFGRRLSVGLRPSALLSVGLPSTSEIPEQLTNFRRDARQGVDPDIFASTEIGLAYRVTTNYSFGLSAQLIAPKIIDLIRYPFASHPDSGTKSVTFDPRLAFALGARFSWWP